MDGEYNNGLDGDFNYSSVRILLIEDHVDTASVFARLLRTHGYRVDVASTLLEARRYCESEHFDLILADLQLPDGLALDLLPLPQRCRGVPAVILSGHGQPQDLQRSIAAGFLAHLIKPVDVDLLLDVVRRSCPSGRIGDHLLLGART